MLEWIKSNLLSLIIIVVTFGIVNLFLVGGQYLWHYKDKTVLDKITKELSMEAVAIKQEETKVVAFQKDLESINIRITNLKNQINDIESMYSDGIPSDIYENYTELINNHNNLTETYNYKSSEYDNLYTAYSKKIDEYNLKVDEGNKLSEKIGGTWYVLPIPTGKH